MVLILKKENKWFKFLEVFCQDMFDPFLTGVERKKWKVTLAFLKGCPANFPLTASIGKC